MAPNPFPVRTTWQSVWTGVHAVLIQLFRRFWQTTASIRALTLGRWCWCTNAVNSRVLLFWCPLMFVILIAWHRHSWLRHRLSVSLFPPWSIDQPQEEASAHNWLNKNRGQFFGGGVYFFLFLFFHFPTTQYWNFKLCNAKAASTQTCRVSVERPASALLELLLQGVCVWSSNGIKQGKKCISAGREDYSPPSPRTRRELP